MKTISPTVTALDESAVRGAAARKVVLDRLGVAREVALGPQTLFCAQPYDSLTHGNNERLGNLMARIMANPDCSLIVATREAFVFAFTEPTEPAKQHDG